MTSPFPKKISQLLYAERHIAPLAVLRVVFGFIMFISTLRFWLKGWIKAYYINPEFHFTFYGFDWVKPLGATGMYVLFGVLAITALMVMTGLFYRIAIVIFFACFTYIELIDKTTYLNHYYFVSIMAFLLMLVPAGRYFSVDVWRKKSLKITQVPAWMINIFRAQLVLVYFFAGISKINHDWLIAAMPLRIWLPANSQLPIIGGLLTHLWVAYVSSWFGMIFDLLAGFFLLKRRTRPVTYLFVLIFHLSTGWFFKIGMFPYIMILVTLVFFSDKMQFRIMQLIRRMLFLPDPHRAEALVIYKPNLIRQQLVIGLLCVHFILQLILPFRYLLYPGRLYWTEEGYRFSWRVMLMEKGGTAFFHVKDPATGTRSEVINSMYLTEFQETQMSTQPDMILQYAHFLADVYRRKGIKNPVVTADSYVTLNGSGSRLYIDSTVNLAAEQEGFGHKKWIIPFNSNQK